MEGQELVKLVRATAIQVFVRLGQPSAGSSGAERMRRELKADKQYQRRKKRAKAALTRGCKMGSKQACDLLKGEAKWID